MVAQNKRSASLRSTFIAAVAGILGVVIGATLGYFGYYLGTDNPIVEFAGQPNGTAFDQTYRGMARIAGLEMSAANCDAVALQRIVENERHLLDHIELSSAKANLTPPLDVARAIVAYRSATIASLRRDNEAFDALIEQEKGFLRAAGWKDTSHDHLASVVRDLDGCSLPVPKERK